MNFNLINNIESCYIDIPGLIYYSHIPTAILALIMGFFIYRNSKLFSSRILLAMTIAFFLQISLNFFVWTSTNGNLIAFAWPLFPIFDIAIFLLAFYFIYVFIKKRDVGIMAKLFWLLLSLPLIILSYKNSDGFSIDNCESFGGEKYLYFLYSFEALITIGVIIFSIVQCVKEKNSTFRRQITLLSMGINLFLISFLSSGALASYLDSIGISYAFEVEQYAFFSTTFFLSVLVYLIVKYKAFNIRLLGAQALIVSQFILIASMFAFIQNKTNMILTGITLFLTAAMGWYLIRSVKKEIALKEELEVSNVELSERKDQLQVMADKLAQSNDQLRVLDNAKSEFISIASHQLRTPLTAIKGFLSLLLEGSYGDVQEKHKEVLNKIYTSNERLITLVEDLLNISRIESGRMEFKFDKWDLDKICREVIDTFVLRAKDHHLYLEYKTPEVSLPEVTIDGVKVREVISNLVDNAIKYTLDGHGGITLRLEQFEDKARVIISDTGIGIPATELPYLFAKFSRGKDISRLNTGGTGLGLYVGKNMIESNGGRIWAESEGQDRGSRFIIEIPLVQSEELMKRWG